MSEMVVHVEKRDSVSLYKDISRLVCHSSPLWSRRFPGRRTLALSPDAL